MSDRGSGVGTLVGVGATDWLVVALTAGAVAYVLGIALAALPVVFMAWWCWGYVRDTARMWREGQSGAGMRVVLPASTLLMAWAVSVFGLELLRDLATWFDGRSHGLGGAVTMIPYGLFTLSGPLNVTGTTDQAWPPADYDATHDKHILDPRVTA
jgi:hypothetical protein